MLPVSHDYININIICFGFDYLYHSGNERGDLISGCGLKDKIKMKQ